MGAHSKGLTPTIGQLWPHHRHMARMFAEGATPGEVAVVTGFTPGQVTRILNSPLFEAEIMRLESMAELETTNVNGELKRMARRAVEILDENMNADDNSAVSRELKTKSAFDVLDRAGYGKKEGVHRHEHLHAHMHRKVEEMPTEQVYEAITDMLNEDEEVMEG